MRRSLGNKSWAPSWVAGCILGAKSCAELGDKRGFGLLTELTVVLSTARLLTLQKILYFQLKSKIVAASSGILSGWTLLQRVQLKWDVNLLASIETKRRCLRAFWPLQRKADCATPLPGSPELVQADGVHRIQPGKGRKLLRGASSCGFNRCFNIVLNCFNMFHALGVQYTRLHQEKKDQLRSTCAECCSSL